MYIYTLRIIGPFIIKPIYDNCFCINGDKETTQAPGYL